MVSDKEIGRTAGENIRKYLGMTGIAILAGICIEMLILLFTDNKMQSATGEAIIRQNVPNTFRVLLLICLVEAVLYRREKILRWIDSKRHADHRLMWVSVGSFLAITVVWSGAFLMLLSIRIKLNSMYYLVGMFSGMAFACFILYYKRRIKRVESLFLAESILFVTLCVFVLPPFAYGGDSAVHLRRSVEMSQSYSMNTFPTYHDMVDDPDSGGVMVDEIRNRVSVEDVEGIQGFHTIDWSVLKNSRHVAYVFFAAGFAISDALNLPAHVAFYIAELCNGCFLCFLLYRGMRKLKCGKAVMLAFSSLPYILILSSRFSYTPWVIAWITYGAALTIGIMQGEGTIEKRELLWLYSVLFLGILPKAPYFFMALFPLLLSKERLGKNRKLNYALCAICVSALVLTLLLPAFISDNGFEMYSDMRGGGLVSATGQLKFICLNPLLYGKYLIKNVYKLLSFESMVLGNNGFTGIGTAMGKLVERQVVLKEIILLLFLFMIVTDRKEDMERYLTGRNRILVTVLTIMGIGIICTVMYMNYTEVGESTFNGINPLYLLTFMFPFFYFCSSPKITATYSWRKYNFFCYGVWMAIMYATVCFRVVPVYIF